MGKKSDAPPAPDYSGVAAASEKSAELAAQTSADQLAWAKSQADQNAAITKPLVNQQMHLSKVAAQNAATDRARYESEFVPLEDKMVATAQGYDTPANEDYMAGRATADVAQQFEGARAASRDTLESYGIDPSQTRYQALDLETRLAQAGASAGAANNSRLQTQATGRDLVTQAVNAGRGLASQSTTETGSAVNTGNSANANTNATTATSSSAMGNPTQWSALGNSALGTWGNTLNMGYSNSLDQFKADQSATSGIGSALGTAAGLGLGAYTGGMFTGGVKPSFHFAEGGAVPIPTPAGSHDGVAVPAGASPSSGAAIDDVPARLNVGEFILPRDVVAWKGQEFLQKLVQKSRQDRVGAPAKPTQQAIPMNQAPAVNTSRSALPV